MSDRAILSYLLQNPDEYDVLHPLLKKSDFKFDHAGIELVHRALSRHWDKIGAFPSIIVCKEMLGQIKALTEEKKALVFGLVDDVYTGTYTEIDKELILGRIMRPSMDELTQLIQNTDTWNWRTQADMIRSKLDDLDILTHKEVGRLFDPFDPSLTMNVEQTLNLYLGGTIPTGNFLTDQQLEGGFRRGELVMPAALPGDGKTMSCMSLGCDILRMSSVGTNPTKDHIYWCILDNTDQETTAKMWANFIRVPTRQLAYRTDEVQDKLRYAEERYGVRGRVWMRKWPRHSRTIADIRRDILLIQRRKGIKFSVIIIDYLDTVSPGSGHKEVRHGLNAITIGAASLAEELDVVVIAPTQLHRAARFVEIPDIENLAEAFSKSWHAAVIFMILASKAERIQNRCRWFWPKTRRAAEKWMLQMERNNLYQEFREVEGVEVTYPTDEARDEVASNAKESKRREKAQKAVKPDASQYEVGLGKPDPLMGG